MAMHSKTPVAYKENLHNTDCILNEGWRTEYGSPGCFLVHMVIFRRTGQGRSALQLDHTFMEKTIHQNITNSDEYIEIMSRRLKMV